MPERPSCILTANGMLDADVGVDLDVHWCSEDSKLASNGTDIMHAVTLW